MGRLMVSKVSALSSCVANDHQTLHHVSSNLSKIPYGGFSPVRLQGRPVRRRLPAQCSTRSLHSSFVLSAAINSTSVLSRSRLLGEAPPFERPSSLYPRGPRSGAGYSVPHPHHLIGPIRPTCRHIEISPHSGLYPMPSLGNIRLGPQVVPCFRCMFLLGMPSSMTPESSSSVLTQLLHRQHWPSPGRERLGALNASTIRFWWAKISGLPGS